ncbi:protein AAR2 homolog [Anoplophora glabripennis]|nr:protein AAR2 homolog [Anoplophora glabripennis]
MDQITAKKLYAEGGIFVFLEVPEGTEFGIDMKSWNTGEKFRGVKMIPPGLHYIFYSAVSDTGDTSPRTGFFHNFKRSEVIVKKWDKKNECISSESVSEAEVVHFKDNILALDNFLGPYPYDIWEKWVNLTSEITSDLVQKLTPCSGYIQSALELESCSDADRPRGKKGGETQDCSSSKKARLSGDAEEGFLPNLKAKQGTELRFTPFPERNYPAGSTPAEITRHSLDSSFLLDTMIANYSKSTELLGELEFCYVCFLVGHSLEAFEQWKKLFSLFCSCDTAVKKHRKLYDLFVSVIEIQVKEIPEEFLADIVSNNNLVYTKLRNLFRAVRNSDVDGQLKAKLSRFQKNLTDLYQWDFEHLDSDEEDEAPVIVET